MTLGRIAGGLAASAAAVVALALPAPAAALSCAAPPPGAPSAFEAADVVFDGIALSGKSDNFGALDSPARVLVTRYLKGGGPRIRRVRTGVQVGPLLVGEIAGDFNPSVGDAVRVYGRRTGPSGPFGVPRGVLFAGLCDRSRYGPGDRLYDRIPGTFRRAAVATGARPWVAFAQRGPHGLRCLRTYRAVRRRPHTHPTDCERLRPGAALVSVGFDPNGGQGGAETAVAAWAPGLREIEVTAIGERARVVPGPAALTVLPGRFDDYEVRIKLTFDDGRVRFSHGDAPLRAFAPDPAGDLGWWAISDDSEGRSCVAADQLPARTPDAPNAYGAYACGDTAARGYFLAARQVRHEPREEGERPAPFRTVVLGRVEAGVRALAVTGPDGVAHELAFARRGGAVLAVLPAGVRARELTVTATYADGLVERRPLR